MTWSYSRLPDLTDEEFSEWQTLLEDRTGISFDRHKRILQTGLTRRMQEIECDSYREYYRKVKFEKGAALEWAALLRTLTVKETRFFRDQDAIDCVRSYLFDLLVDDRRDGPLELWSVACSTGEEPYSLAMVTNDTIEGLGVDSYFGVTATDICLASLAEARRGVYPVRKLDVLDGALAERYFDIVDDKSCSVAPWLKQRICFVQANLINMENLPVTDMDVIYCQNVLIYFKQWRRKQVLDSLVDRLKPNGLLIIGMGEAMDWVNNKVERVKSDVVHAYIKVA